MVKWKVNERKIRPCQFSSYYMKITSSLQKHKDEIENEPEKQPNKIFLHEKLVLRVIKDCKTLESLTLKIRLGFNLCDINNKQQTLQ